MSILDNVDEMQPLHRVQEEESLYIYIFFIIFINYALT